MNGILSHSTNSKKIQQIMAKTIPTTDMTSDALPSWRALFDELETVLCAATIANTHNTVYRVAQNKIPHQTICNICATSGLILKILEAALS